MTKLEGLGNEFDASYLRENSHGLGEYGGLTGGGALSWRGFGQA